MTTMNPIAIMQDEHRRQIAALESQLAAAIDALRPFAEDYTEMLPEADMLTHVIERYEKAHEIVTAHDARQSAVPVSIPPERADAVARVQQRYADDRAQVSRVYADGLARVRDVYLRRMNEALNADENGV